MSNANCQAISSCHELRFPNNPLFKTVYSLGRNGEVLTSGVQIYSGFREMVVLTPITSQGRVASRCHVGIAKDKQTLLDLAYKLQAIADSL